MNIFVSKITSQQELFPFKDPHNPLIPWWVCLFIMGKFAFFFMHVLRISGNYQASRISER